MGNSGERRFEPVLRAWTSDPDPVIAESAAWALGQLTASDTHPVRG
jgi:hypothetical protein